MLKYHKSETPQKKSSMNVLKSRQKQLFRVIYLSAINLIQHLNHQKKILKNRSLQQMTLHQMILLVKCISIYHVGIMQKLIHSLSSDFHLIDITRYSISHLLKSMNQKVIIIALKFSMQILFASTEKMQISWHDSPLCSHSLGNIKLPMSSIKRHISWIIAAMK